jgi:hypothetical protein
MQVTSILFRFGRNPNDAPHRLRASRNVAGQQITQAAQIESVRLRAPALLRHFDARRVDDQVLDPLGDQEPVKPEAFAARFITTHDAHLPRQPELLLGTLDLGQQCLRVT